MRNLPDHQAAADALAKINRGLQRTIAGLAQKRGDADPDVRRVRANYDPESVSESTTESRYYTSYSVNKGEKIVICLRSRDSSREISDLNTLMYVALHELAHLMTEEIGHTPQFWSNFREVLEVAVREGVYAPVDYTRRPQEYCGVKIQNSVLTFD